MYAAASSLLWAAVGAAPQRAAKAHNSPHRATGAHLSVVWAARYRPAEALDIQWLRPLISADLQKSQALDPAAVSASRGRGGGEAVPVRGYLP
ncbi:hypothetical protein EDB81DRAFT_345190 [Dactylonectria macrodidyma]|uniref:Uncharacterized protein n=1 Tax=Dactylonectria macrodidyma TaxID=307937 RepID=A0A9P9FG56_9HYPO|nr:hypothetical protein EDB81DRAFT_345190 [Dactylonectria macrodidyma]